MGPARHLVLPLVCRLWLPTLVLVLLAESGRGAAPVNDPFANRIVLTGTSAASGSTLVGATREPEEPLHSSPGTGPSLWWEWTAPHDLSVSLGVAAPNASLAIAVYTGNTLSDLVRLAGDVDGDGTACRLSLRAVAGTTYLIAVEGRSGTGTVTLRLLPGPPNDDFASRRVLDPGPVYLGTTTLGATVEPGEPDFGLSAPRHTVWYEWPVAAAGGWEARLQAGYSGATVCIGSGDSLAHLTLRATADAGQETTGACSFRVTAGERLFIRVAGKEDGGGSFTLFLVAPPPNDDFANREIIPAVGTTYAVPAIGATREPGEPNHGGLASGRSLWWEFTAPSTGGFWLDAQASVGAPIVEVYQGASLENLLPVPSNWVATETTLQRAFHARAGEKYFIALVDTSALGATLRLTLRASPANDDFAAALPLAADGVPIDGSTVGATTEPGEPRLSYGQGATVWYRFRPPGDGNYVARLTAPEVPLMVAVFVDDPVAGLLPVNEGEAVIGGRESLAGFRAAAGVDHFIVVDSTGYNRGPFSVRLSPAASNDDFANATVLPGLSVTNQVPAFLASREPGEPAHGGLTNAPSLWWRWTAPASGGYEVRIEHGYSQAALAVYAGSRLQTVVRVADHPQEVDDVTTLFFHAESGVEYSIAFSQLQSGATPVAVSIEPGQPNDDFANRRPLPGTFQSENVPFRGATREPDEPALAELPDGGTLWWQWIAPATGSFLFTAKLGATTDVALGVFTGDTLQNLVLLDSGIATPRDFLARATIRAVAGATYPIVLAANAPVDETLLTLRLLPGPANDDFAQRAPLAGAVVLVGGTTDGATRESAEPAHGGRTTGASVWFTWTAPANGEYIASAAAPASGATWLDVNVYQGTELNNLQAVSVPGSTATRVRFSAVEGAVYQIAVDSTRDTAGGFGLSISPPPPNDNYADRIELAGTSIITTGANVNATSEPLRFETPAYGPPYNSVWWTWQPPGDGLVRLTLKTSELFLHPRVQGYADLPGTGFAQFMEGSAALTTNLLDVKWVANAGLTADLRVTTSGGDSTNLTLELAFEPHPPLTGKWAAGPFRYLRGGNALWFEQTAIFHDGPTALQSGPLPPAKPDGWGIDASASAVQTVVPGPGKVKFWWKSSCHPQLDRLECSVLNAPAGRFVPGLYDARIAGQTDWRAVTLQLPDRTNIVAWTFYRGSSVSSGSNAGWIDGVTVEPKLPNAFGFQPPVLDASHALRLTLTAEKQREYAVEGSTNLAQWFGVTNVFSPAGGLLRFNVSPAPNASALFLRARALVP